MAGSIAPAAWRLVPTGISTSRVRTADSVLRYDGATGELIDEFVAAGSGGLDSPRSLIFNSDGMLYVSSYGGDSVLRYDGTTGAFIDEFATTGSGGLDGPWSMTFGPDADLYVASFIADSVLRYDGATGAFVGEFVGQRSRRPERPGGRRLPRGRDALRQLVRRRLRVALMTARRVRLSTSSSRPKAADSTPPSVLHSIRTATSSSRATRAIPSSVMTALPEISWIRLRRAISSIIRSASLSARTGISTLVQADKTMFFATMG